MQSFSHSTVPPAGPKNYVFVDEHNRHKRLKVMRACEGCRRRKIKCDSATTNSWPCAACTRLKLHCVPPVGGVDGDNATATSFAGTDVSSDYQTYDQPDIDISENINSQQPYPASFTSDPGHPLAAYNQYHSNYQKASYGHLEDSYDALYATHHQFDAATADSFQAGHPIFRTARSDSDTHTQGTIDQHTAEELSQHLGDLKIAENGIAPYIRQQEQNSKEPEAPLQEPELKLAAFSTDAGAHIRIPPALMPGQDDALRCFQTFFKDVHPYAPVLCRNQFYHQWHTDKGSISPLVLEAIFACTGRMSEDPAQGAQWLALANQHEACFLDTPRLSTLQALLLLLKARESAPKRGYYYRSWMTCKTIVSMAKDLELHEHHDLHKSGEKCGSDPVECLTKTRIWQTILICEMMIGAPQGRRDFGVDPNSVDISPNPPCADIDDFEKSTSRQFAYFLRNARNIRLITDVTHRIKKKKDWGLDQELVAYNTAFTKWPDDLPRDLQVTLPADGESPKIPSHFIGNMHSHYHLGVVMLHRAQLSASVDLAWKHHMTVCYTSAKALCLLQETVLAKFDLAGLLCMQRGINFTIYTILTCVMIHLIAITSPDPEFHADARDYFVRHMRILERCISAWPMPETEAQINGLRAAFSADLSKPFELKQSFPLGTPTDQFQSSPVSKQLSEPPQHHLPHPRQEPILIPQAQTYLPQQISQIQQSSYLATPPVSAISSDSKPQSPQFQQPYGMDHAYNDLHVATYYRPTSAPDQPPWNPTPIINQFNTAFAIPPAALAPPPSLYGSPPPGQLSSVPSHFTTATSSPPYPQVSYSQQQQQAAYYQQHPNPSLYMDPSSNHALGSHSNPPPRPQVQQPPQSQQMPVQAPSKSSNGTTYVDSGIFVTPKEWQQSVASVLKRGWDYDQDERMNKRR